jgi:hypothetical protein
VKGWGSLWEVKNQWTLPELVRAHELLDLMEEQERKALEKQRAATRRK